MEDLATAITFFLKSFLTFFVIVDPPGNLPIFIALTERFEEKVRQRISKRMTIIALAILLATMVSGGGIL
ncbi:MAG: MarC family protein, partial [Archaeoglobaceae archaeon]